LQWNASALVGLATTARLMSSGRKPGGPLDHERIARIRTRQEIAFLRHVADSDVFIERIIADMERMPWTWDAQREQKLRNFALLNPPDWLYRWYSRRIR
jgi:hypothetical protein